MKQIDVLISQYIELFNEYPYFYMCGLDKDIQRQLLEAAIKENVPIEPRYKKGSLY